MLYCLPSKQNQPAKALFFFRIIFSLVALLVLSGCDYIADRASPQKDSVRLAEDQYLLYRIPRPWQLVENNEWAYKGKSLGSTIRIRTGIKDERGRLAEIAKNASAALDKSGKKLDTAIYLLDKNNRRAYSKDRSPDFDEVQSQEKKLDGALAILYKAKEHPENMLKAKILLDEAAKKLSVLGSLQDRFIRDQSVSGHVIAEKFVQQDLSGIPYIIATADYNWYGRDKRVDKYIFFEFEGAYTLISFTGIVDKESVADEVARSMVLVRGDAPKVNQTPIGRTGSARRREVENQSDFKIPNDVKVLLLYLALISLPAGGFSLTNYIGQTKAEAAGSSAKAAAAAAVFFTVGTHLLISLASLGMVHGPGSKSAGLMVGLALFMFTLIKLIAAVVLSLATGVAAFLGARLGGLAGQIGAGFGALGGTSIVLILLNQLGALRFF